MANTIRITGTKRIEVNDDGECIVLPVGDDSFVKRFYELVENTKKKADGMQPDNENIMGFMDDVIEFDKELKERVDGLFGADTCRKVFGDILPSVDMFIEFFSLILPFFEDYKKDRMAKMNKYSAGRKGSSV